MLIDSGITYSATKRGACSSLTFRFKDRPPTLALFHPSVDNLILFTCFSAQPEVRIGVCICVIERKSSWAHQGIRNIILYNLVIKNRTRATSKGRVEAKGPFCNLARKELREICK